MLEEAGIETASLDARLLICHACGLSHEDFILLQDQPLKRSEEHSLTHFLKKRIEGMPVSRILGYRAFWKHRFYINEATLDPRPDSECLIESVLEYASQNKLSQTSLKILDLGTGSGCLLISLLKEFKNAVGVGVDLSYDALRVAKHNADITSIGKRALFVKSDWLACMRGYFDIIVSNPPYIVHDNIKNLEKGVRDYDPILALSGGADGLSCYQDIVNQLLQTDITKEAFLVFEVGHTQAHHVKNLLNNYPEKFHTISYSYDLNHYKRCVTAMIKK